MSNYFQTLIPEPGSLPVYDTVFELKGIDRYNRDALVVISKRRDSGTKPVEDQVRGMGVNSVDINVSFTDGDFFRPVVGTYCDMVIVSRNYKKLFPLMQADETQYLVKVYENHDTPQERILFRGFYRPDSFRQQWQRGKAMVHISATSGLGLLRYIKFTPPPVGPGFQGIENEGPVFGEYSAAHVLSYLFYLAGNRHDWLDMVPYNWSDFVGVHVPYFEQPIPVSHYYDKNCMDVLQSIMENFDTQVLQVNGMLAIRMMDDPATDHFRRYNYRGEYQDNVDPEQINSPLQTIITTGTHTKDITGRISTEVAYRRLIVRNKNMPFGNLIFNGDFEKEYAGWYKSASLPDDHFSILGTPYNRMILKFLMPESASSPSAYPPENYIDEDYHVNNHFSRGDFGGNVFGKFRVSFYANVSGVEYLPGGGFISYNHVLTPRLLRVRLYDKTADKIIYPNEWGKQFHFDFYSWSYAGDGPYLRIYVPIWIPTLSQSLNPSITDIIEEFIEIKDVKVESYEYNIGTGEYVPLKEIISEEIITLNEHSIRDAVEEVTHFGGNRYAWKDRTPGLRLRHRTGEGVMSVEDWKKQRLSTFYSQARKKLNITSIVKELVPINGLSMIQEPDLDTTFLISSMKYALMRKTVELDLLQYRNYLLNYPEPPIPEPESEWILATGSWNDDGIWIDTAHWYDSEPGGVMPPPE